MKHSYAVWKSLALATMALSLMGLRCTPSKSPPEPKAEFERFGVLPNPICTNLGIPILRISWEVKGVGESCLSNVKINGNGVNGDLWAVGIQGGRCGEGDYTRETAFSLNDAFGNNIPSAITVDADLTRLTQAGVFVSSEILDSASASTVAQECTAGFTPEG